MTVEVAPNWKSFFAEMIAKNSSNRPFHSHLGCSFNINDVHFIFSCMCVSRCLENILFERSSRACSLFQRLSSLFLFSRTRYTSPEDWISFILCAFTPWDRLPVERLCGTTGHLTLSYRNVHVIDLRTRRHLTSLSNRLRPDSGGVFLLLNNINYRDNLS